MLKKNQRQNINEKSKNAFELVYTYTYDCIVIVSCMLRKHSTTELHPQPLVF
jgi:hypothetical protein